jgi:ABC-2 type transport system ATP-binding protein
MLEATGLQKRYGRVTAVTDVSLSVRAGEIVGLLGPNGAGKTTTVSMICGLTKPDAGRVTIDGRALGGDADPVKRRIGLVPQDIAIYDELSARDNLKFFGALYGLTGRALAPQMERALTLVGLADRAADRAGTYSGGMKRRLNLAASLLHDPAILLLDEPTVGVDPQSRSSIFDTLETLRDQGKALVYTTHYMEEAERLCNRIIVIDHGQVIADDTLRGLYKRLPALNRLIVELDETSAPDWVPALRAEPFVRGVSVDGSRVAIDVDDLGSGTAAVAAWLAAKAIKFSHLRTERGNLETVFLSLTGRNLRD